MLWSSRNRNALAGLILASILASAAHAAEPVDRLRFRWRLDVPLALLASLGFVTLDVYKGGLAPDKCRWCDRNADGSDSLNGLDRNARDALRWSDTRAASRISDVLGYGLGPAAALGLNAIVAHKDGRARREWRNNAIIIAQGALLAQSITRLVKFAAARERPYVHALPLDDPQRGEDPDQNTSFLSGHASYNFALAVGAGTVASMRGYRHTRWVWAVGLSIATATGYLRIAGDRHYLTDVLGGAALGSAVGFSVPYLLHRKPREQEPATRQLSLLPQRGGAKLALTWRW